MSADLLDIDALALVARQLPPSTIAEAVVARIAATNGTLHSFISFDAADLQQQAYHLERESARGPLHSVPVAIKDNIDVCGQPTTAGTSFLADHVATSDAAAVTSLRAAGALVCGKTNLHEFAYGATGVNPHH